MTAPRRIRDFDLEVFFSRWEFAARHHMTASDLESLSMRDLLAMAAPEDRAAFDDLWLGYTQTGARPHCAPRSPRPMTGWPPRTF